MALLGAQFVNAVSPNPVGSVQAYAGASAPTGWLLCDGSVVPQSVYPELFSVISSTYNTTGEGAGNFRLPDLRGRVLVGKGTHVDVDALGDNDGSSLANRRPKHQHTIYDPTHKHDAYGTIDNINVGAGGTGYARNLFAYNLPTTYSATGVKINPEGAASSSSPQDGPAFLVTNYIIKAVADAPRSGLAYGSTPPIVTALPSNPQFGDVVTYIADATNGVAWGLQYDATGTYPWKFIGGAPLYAQGASSYVAITSTTYVDAGASMTLALAGDYDIRMDAQIQMPASNASVTYTSIATNSSAASDYVGPIAFANATSSVDHGGSKASRFTVAAGEIAKIRARVSTATGYVGFTRLIATPVRVKAA